MSGLLANGAARIPEDARRLRHLTTPSCRATHPSLSGESPEGLRANVAGRSNAEQQCVNGLVVWRFDDRRHVYWPRVQ